MKRALLSFLCITLIFVSGAGVTFADTDKDVIQQDVIIEPMYIPCPLESHDWHLTGQGDGYKYVLHKGAVVIYDPDTGEPIGYVDVSHDDTVHYNWYEYSCSQCPETKSSTTDISRSCPGF